MKEVQSCAISYATTKNLKKKKFKQAVGCCKLEQETWEFIWNIQIYVQSASSDKLYIAHYFCVKVHSHQNRNLHFAGRSCKENGLYLFLWHCSHRNVFHNAISVWTVP